jgi:hypothetical protein
MYTGIHVKKRYSCHILMKFETSRQIFEKYSNIKFHENPSGWSRIFPWGETRAEPEGRTDGQTGRHDEANKLANL